MKSKRVLCFALAVLMILPLGMISSFAATCSCPNDPYVYIQGQGSVYVEREDGSVYAPLDEDTYDAAELSKELLPLLFEAIKTDDWTEYGTALYNMIANNYQEIKVEPDGSIKSNTRASGFRWNENTIHSQHAAHMGYANHYIPEWRLSPMDVADDINNYIETVKRKSGHDKVNLVGRCLGGSYVMAYVQKYGYDSIKSVTFLAPAHNGAEAAQAIFSGKLKLDSTALARFMAVNTNMQAQIGDKLVEYLILTINALRETYTDQMVIAIVQKLYDNIKDITFAPLVREYYAAGGNFSTVNEDFEEAMEYLYPTDELKEAYAIPIEKARYFHENVQLKSKDIVADLEAHGIPVFTVAEYGYQIIPIGGETTNRAGERTLSVMKQAGGATTSSISTTLSQNYIDSRIEAGFGKYISPDKQIDASTGYNPDRTWYIKNLNHTFPEALHVLVNYLVFSPTAPTVDSNPRYPQYLLYTQAENGREDLVTLTEENANNIDWSQYENTDGQAKKLFNIVIDFIKGLFNGFLDKIFEMVKKIKGTFH